MPTPASPPHAHGATAPQPDVADLAEALERIDPVVLGGRIRTLRAEKKLTQAHVVRDAVSVAYLSRIESGARRPNLKVLRVIARNLGSSPHELLLGLSPVAWSERRLELDWAQLSLRTGDAAGALERTTRLVADIPRELSLSRVARHVHALALEATGDFERAIGTLEELTEEVAEANVELAVLTALTRSYREAGEFGRAIDMGRRAAEQLTSMGLEGSSEGIRLVLTVAGAHIESGDLRYAYRLCAKALKAAESLESTFERAGAYWNASVVESMRGRHAEAVELAQRALVLMEESESARNAARLRSQLGDTMLMVDEPDVSGAMEHLRRAEQEMLSTGTNPADRASNRLAQARAHLLSGDLVTARAHADQALESVIGSVPLVSAAALALLGRISFAEADTERARHCYIEAVEVMAAWGENVNAAQLWFELGELCLSVGETTRALEAFQRAGRASGLRPPTARTTDTAQQVRAASSVNVS